MLDAPQSFGVFLNILNSVCCFLEAWKFNKGNSREEIQYWRGIGEAGDRPVNEDWRVLFNLQHHRDIKGGGYGGEIIPQGNSPLMFCVSFAVQPNNYGIDWFVDCQSHARRPHRVIILFSAFRKNRAKSKPIDKVQPGHVRESFIVAPTRDVDI